jgi:hypothetical protein
MKILRRQFLHLAAGAVAFPVAFAVGEVLVEAVRVRVRRQRQLRRQSPYPDGVAGGLCPVFHADARDS